MKDYNQEQVENSTPPALEPNVLVPTTTSAATTSSTTATSKNAGASATTPVPTQHKQNSVPVSDPPPPPPPELPPPPPPQPSPSELQRLAWIKSCIPWSKVSNEPWKLSQATGKVHKKPSSAKKLPAVAEAVVLAAAHADTLRQV
ncbi:hypothetical protein EGW08_006081 [Elysia chlorotica]|uniref:Uncharacterized protein n=1 Tax=Elysia chlorotica TaxID=188477 RepID=A0A3S1HU19_ELYCH|nr:hypothetical protein EGW08_006081 [Elysia chlorotica]